MPTYEYECSACGHQFEEFQSIKAKPTLVCPKCKKRKVKRLVSGGAGFIFKGSGFYETDYRSENYKKSEKAESAPKAAEPAKESAAKTQAAPAKGAAPPAKTQAAPAKGESNSKASS